MAGLVYGHGQDWTCGSVHVHVYRVAGVETCACACLSDLFLTRSVILEMSLCNLITNKSNNWCGAFPSKRSEGMRAARGWRGRVRRPAREPA